MTTEEVIWQAAQAADEKKGHHIAILDLRDISMMTDYFLIVDAETEVQVRSIADGIRGALEAHGTSLKRREGWDDASWVLLDYGDAVVHVFQTDARKFYGLERLWGDAPTVPFDPENTAFTNTASTPPTTKPDSLPH